MAMTIGDISERCYQSIDGTGLDQDANSASETLSALGIVIERNGLDGYGHAIYMDGKRFLSAGLSNSVKNYERGNPILLEDRAAEAVDYQAYLDGFIAGKQGLKIQSGAGFTIITKCKSITLALLGLEGMNILEAENGGRMPYIKAEYKGHEILVLTRYK